MTSTHDNSTHQFDSICIICWGLIGDVLIRVPVIELLKKHYPEARVTCLVDAAAKQVLQNHPDVENIVIYSRNEPRKFSRLIQRIRLIIKLRRKKFDLSINLYSGGSSPIISRCINAKTRLGFDHTWKLRMSNTLSAGHPSFCQHWSAALAQILAPLGIDPISIRRGTSFYISKESKLYASKIINGRKCIIFNLGAGQNNKLWPIESYVQLARYIQDKYHYLPLVITNPGMEHLAEAFRKLYDSNTDCEILPSMDLDKVAAILNQSVALVTGDTSIMHISFGVKTPTLVLFTYTRPEWAIAEDCPSVYCFKEDASVIDQKCKKPMGSKDIDIADARNKFDELMDLITHE